MGQRSGTETAIQIMQAFLRQRTWTQAALAASLDGYHESIEPIECRFFVAEQAARWVKYNLPDGFTSSPVEGGIEVLGVTAGIRPLARFIAGLGAEARAIPPQLAAVVRELALGSANVHQTDNTKPLPGTEATLAANVHQTDNTKLKLRSVRSKRSTR
jgi:hypothetical protein